jgi:phytol kinase
MVEWLGTIDKLELKCLIAAGWLVVVAVLALITERLTPKGSEFVRKVVHIATGQVILLAWWMNIPAWIGVGAGVFFSLVSIASYYYPLLPSIHNVGRRTWGTCFYAMSIGILVGVFWPIGRPEFAVLGVLVMTWGDGLAGLIGKQWGRRQYELWGVQKSLEGSATMAIVSAIVTLAVLLPIGYGGAAWVCAMVVGICAAGLETWGKVGIDNLTVPIGSAAIAYALMKLL